MVTTRSDHRCVIGAESVACRGPPCPMPLSSLDSRSCQERRDMSSVARLFDPSSAITIRGARVHNLQDIDLDLPRRPAGGLHRGQRFGEELARLRHDLRRGAAAVHRVSLELCPPVPRPARAARRRPDRGPAADRGHRPEGGPGQPAEHGRHAHRDPRLSAPALRPARHAVLPAVRSWPSTARPPSRWSPTCWPFPRDERSSSWPRWCGDGRGSTWRCSRRSAARG